MNEIKELIKRIERVKLDYQPTIDSFPDEPATTVKQQELESTHGTPRAFARALVNAIGTISCSEADFHMRCYLKKWEAAGQ